MRTYLSGVGEAMRRHSPAFYDDMVNYAAARRVHELTDEGLRAGDFRNVNGTFADLGDLLDGLSR